MKFLSRLPYLFASFLFFTTGSLLAQTPKPTKAEEKAAAKAALKTAIENRQYNFFEQNTILNVDGNVNTHSTPYMLDLEGDTLETDLPDFARAYTVNSGRVEKRYRFATTEFNYKVRPGKKEGWEVTITPRNQNYTARILMNISAEGYATVQVNGHFIGNSSFSGIVTAN